MKTNTQNNKGFTLIELIMVTIILGILAAVAIPRYTATVERAEAAAEDAVISSIRAGLETYATEQLMEHGRPMWTENPFDALETEPTGYTDDGDEADEDGEWTFITDGPSTDATDGFEHYTGTITHMRGDNSVETWDYDAGSHTAQDESSGSLGARNP